MAAIELNNDQIFAEYEANAWWHNQNDQVFEIAGAAGTGKTTCIKYILHRLGIPIKKVLFVAFTGKAATQLARNGLPARTTCSAFYEYVPEICRDENHRIIMLPNGRAKTKLVKKKLKKLKGNYECIVIDEATMINATEREDILSFGLPIFALGDINQLPPTFGRAAFMLQPNVILRQLMRQAEDDPIVWIAHRILNGQTLNCGVYGKSCIIKRSDLTDMHFKSANIIITGTNKLRHAINLMFREDFNNFRNLEFPYVGEKVLCKRNNWTRSLGDSIYLTNGLTGFIDFVDRESYNGKRIKFDFRPDFTKKIFRNLNVDYQRLMRTDAYIESEDSPQLSLGMDLFEFGYAITTYASQGSQWENVLGLAEIYNSDIDFIQKYLYTMVTRASNSITLGIEKERLFLS